MKPDVMHTALKKTTYLFYDSFTGTNGTTLPSHTPEKGVPWVTDNGNEITLNGSGRAVAPANGPSYQNRLNLPSGWSTITTDFVVIMPSATPGVCGLAVDYVDANNYVFMGTLFDQCFVYKYVAGVQTVLANVPWNNGVSTDGSTETLKIVYTGSHLLFSRNGVLQYDLTWTLSTNKVGLFLQQNGIGNKCDADYLAIT